MSKNISINNLGSAIQDVLEEYQEKVEETVKEVLPKVGKEAVKELKSTSPKRTGRYAKGWKSEVEETRIGTTVTVYNSDRYQLTHLLEKGHANRGGGRTAARPHIRPTEQHAIKNAVDYLKKNLEK